ncbi:MAG: shikimate kinase [Rhodospirillaceae bacterium]|jgi:shikimate kinase|nr:shikimate kinase [Rhodospirillaceae bacterium]
MKQQFLPEISKTIVLVGLMGAGKTCIGQRLAKALNLPFVDADDEIEKAAGCSISDIFELYGEPKFRDGEKKVISRLLDDPIHVLATGGGAFVNRDTRERIKKNAISIWIRADIELLLSRTRGRNNRPLLKNTNPRAKLQQLINQRYPSYRQADMVIDSGYEAPDITVKQIINAIETFNLSIRDR